ncbi:hypothetical protein C6503_22125 [Candidatus Poribacteria bacterium]|nr:MAG: hypothetical protein C6503_22125 [Candidatus Poribacteria bacterium]
MILRKIATFAFIFAIVGLVIGLSGCERIPPPPVMDDTEMPPTMAEGITIGVALALTGEYAEPYGIPMQEGLELAREELNMLDDVNITFITEDAKSTAEGAKEAVQALVNAEVPAIVGIGISTHLKEAFPVAQAAGVVAFSPISSAAGLSGEIGDFVFRAGLAVNILNPLGLEITQEELDYTKVATIYDAADTYSTSSNAEIVKALEASSVKVLTQETFQTDDTDFKTQLTNIMDMEPDAVFVAALSVEMVQIIAQAKEVGISVPLIVPDLTIKEVQAAGDAAEGVITISGWSAGSDAPGSQEFVQKYRDKYEGSEPLPWAAQAYATLHILANAIMKAPSTDAADIRDALAMTMDLDTILGKFSFDPNGEAMYDRVRERVVHIVKDGQLQPFGEKE